ncbi:hypothetical protein [Cloacibacillus sp.]|uniref:hypothetical protein n=1 Tax=Cloacibacillus sp. TaxID=2049023 RepID=UPI0025BBC78E|nr:hypothetical protein [Cloacibacillus sp.]MCC8057651.1 hypothetical protein [Cloacibacillus sp.]MCC8178622.1 hypothetical protein [Cloacibacillus sp.]
MKKIFLAALLPLAVCLFGLRSYAGPAFDAPICVTQPDGSVIEIRKRGDERGSWYESAEGAYALLFDAKTKWWYFAVSKEGRLISLGVPYREGEPAPLPAAKDYRPARGLERHVSGEAIALIKSGITSKDYAAEPEKSHAAMRKTAEKTAAEAEGVVVQLFSPVPSEEGEMLIMAHIKEERPGKDPRPLIERLKKIPAVLNASPNGISRPLSSPKPSP